MARYKVLIGTPLRASNETGRRAEAAVGAVVALGCAGLLYTAFDLTWWSVH